MILQKSNAEVTSGVFDALTGTSKPWTQPAGEGMVLPPCTCTAQLEILFMYLYGTSSIKYVFHSSLAASDGPALADLLIGILVGRKLKLEGILMEQDGEEAWRDGTW